MSSRLLRRGAIAASVQTGATVLASDTFTRANAAALGTSSSGHTWNEYLNAWQIDTNQAQGHLDGGYYIATLPAGQADVDITLTFDPKGTNADGGIAAKVADANNWIFFDISFSSGRWLCKVFQMVSGSFTGLTSLIDPVTVLGADNTTPFTARLRTQGQAGEVWINGVSQATWSSLADTGILTATAHGMASGDGGVSRRDDITITAA